MSHRNSLFSKQKKHHGANGSTISPDKAGLTHLGMHQSPTEIDRAQGTAAGPHDAS